MANETPSRIYVSTDRQWAKSRTPICTEEYVRARPAPDPEPVEGEPVISRKDLEQWLLGTEKIEIDPHARLMYIYAAGVVRSEVKLRDRLRARVQPPEQDEGGEDHTPAPEVAPEDMRSVPWSGFGHTPTRGERGGAGARLVDREHEILETAEAMVRSALDAQAHMGAFDLDTINQRDLPAPLRVIHALLRIVHRLRARVQPRRVMTRDKLKEVLYWWTDHPGDPPWEEVASRLGIEITLDEGGSDV